MPAIQLYDKVQEAIAFLRQHTATPPKFGLILGTGLSGLTDEITDATTVLYRDIPHFPVSTVQSHRGKMIFGNLGGVPVVAMAGRFHYYEGYDMEQVTFPVRVLQGLGIKRLVISNASGSVNPEIEAGDIVFVRDHINFMPANPLRGQNDDRFGPRFPDMLKTYDRELNAKGVELALARGISAHEGVYLGLAGPNLETPAEYNFFHLVGADLVGMSTVPEVLVSKHMNLPVLVVSVVSNKCYPLNEIQEVTVEEVIAKVGETAPHLQAVITELLQFM